MSVHDPCLGKAPNAWRGDEISRSPTPTLYQVSGGYGSQVARLALVEKGVAFKSRYVDLNSDTTQARDQGGQGAGAHTGRTSHGDTAPALARRRHAPRACLPALRTRVWVVYHAFRGVLPPAACWQAVGRALGLAPVQLFR